MSNGASLLSIPAALTEFILLGPADEYRLLQDSPLLGDVWLAYSRRPAEVQDLLITPHLDFSSGRVASAITKGVEAIAANFLSPQGPDIAYLQGIVVARLQFYEVARIVVPLTYWWKSKRIIDSAKDRTLLKGMQDDLSRLFSSFYSKNTIDTEDTRNAEFPGLSAVRRYLALTGLILWAGQEIRNPPSKRALQHDAEDTLSLRVRSPQVCAEMVRLLEELFDHIISDRSTGWHLSFFANQPAGTSNGTSAPQEHLIFNVSLNRRAKLALDRSVASVKADATQTLFKVNCSSIAWAIVDSGIDQEHVAFKDANGASRVKATYDFTRIREIIRSGADSELTDPQRVDRLRNHTNLEHDEAAQYLRQLADDADHQRPRNWALIEKFIRLTVVPTPQSPHGTHVAGIIGGSRSDTDPGSLSGLCPDIRLYDFRILGNTIEETEFAIIAALQFIRYLNEQHNYIVIHGANLSLAIPHDVRNFACGRTPVCDECGRLVNNGVVVVAAAGNRGYQSFETKDGTFDSYAAFSITDPGNAADVITVGSTHRYWPHTYGISYFSSRGPTGDGRLKPDLVAPGERIQAPLPCQQWGAQSGTSMAAPHVSGAAAMLLARYPELIGQPQRIKKILCESATDLGRERSFQGSGMLDVLRAFQSI